MPRQKIIANIGFAIAYCALLYFAYRSFLKIYNDVEGFNLLLFLAGVNVIALYAGMFKLMGVIQFEKLWTFILFLTAPILIVALIWYPVTTYAFHYVDTHAELNPFLGLAIYIFLPMFPVIIGGLIQLASE